MFLQTQVFNPTFVASFASKKVLRKTGNMLLNLDSLFLFQMAIITAGILFKKIKLILKFYGESPRMVTPLAFSCVPPVSQGLLCP